MEFIKENKEIAEVLKPDKHTFNFSFTGDMPAPEKKYDVRTRPITEFIKEKIEYSSTYEERINQTPRENSDRGHWEGERGESTFIPKFPEILDILNEYRIDSIKYEDGIPDFSKTSESTVEIDNMTEKRQANFEQCDQKCAEQWNEKGRDEKTDWTAGDVKQWRRDNNYSWHERNDMKTCDLVPTKINDFFGHVGGVSEYKKLKSEKGGFDE